MGRLTDADSDRHASVLRLGCSVQSGGVSERRECGVEHLSKIRAANVSHPSPLLGRGFLAGGEGESTFGLSLQLSLFPKE